VNQKLPSDTFCILPWIHFFHSPDGTIAPCCAAQSGNEFGLLRNFASVDEIVNTDAMKSVRSEMLSNKQPKACQSCYREESLGLRSFRQNKNSDIDGIDIDGLVANTDQTGTLQNFKMQYWDSRFSNICNLKCRMCGPGYSHTWAEETKSKPYVIRANGDDSWDTLIQRYGDLSNLREVYFAGGESLFQVEHWQMLDHLSNLGLNDIKITYTTNLSKLGYGNYRIENYLNNFTNVLFIVSLDGTGKLLEYIRSGSKWDDIVKNIDFVQQFPGVKLKFNIVITIYNILYLSDIIDFAYTATKNFNKLDLTVAHGPPSMNIVNLPQELKDLAIVRLKNSQHYSQEQAKIDGVINYLKQSAIMSWSDVMSETNRLDTVRNENILEIVPEFRDYWGK
jgi:sulfatase maturation enzyme AslB (radical SAM superfamily)